MAGKRKKKKDEEEEVKEKQDKEEVDEETVDKKEPGKKNKDNEDEDGEEEEGGKSKISLSKLKLPLIIAVVSVVAIGCGLVFSGFLKSRAKSADKPPKKEVIAKTGVFISMGDCTVNLVGGQSYIQISVTLELDSADKGLQSQIKKKKPQINDAIITIVSSKTSEELLSLEGKDKLKTEIRDKVDSLINAKKIKGVYFTTFIMQ